MYFMRTGVLKPGRNVIAIRVLKTKPDGGFLGKPEELHLASAPSKTSDSAGRGVESEAEC